jgi:hypothetical protein
MRPLSTNIIGHFLGALVTLFGIWWLVINIAEMPDYKLIVVLAALNILVLNHFRWWNLGGKTDGGELWHKVDHIVVSNYMVLLLFLVMLDFRR